MQAEGRVAGRNQAKLRKFDRERVYVLQDGAKARMEHRRCLLSLDSPLCEGSPGLCIAAN